MQHSYGINIGPFVLCPLTRTEFVIMLFQKNTAFCILALTFLCSNQLVSADETANALEGEWTVSEMVFHGHHSLDKRIAGTRFIFSKDSFVIDSTDVDNPLYRGQKVSFSVSTERGINSIETTNLDGKLRGTKRTGIWKIDRDSLTLCIPTDENAEKPHTFNSSQEAKNIIYVMRRESAQ